MNLLAVLKGIFPSPPTLDEYIKAHNPQSVLDVEMLERQYDHLMRSATAYNGVVTWN